MKRLINSGKPFALLSASALALAWPTHAQAQASRGTKPKVKAAAKAAPIAKKAPAARTVAAPLSPYETLRAASKATRVESLEQVRQFHPQLAGRTVEVRARVAGVIGTREGQRVLMQVDKADGTQASMQFDISEALRADADSMRALRPGARVRVLASVSLEMADPLVSPLAVTDTVEPAPLFREDESDRGEGEVIIMEPMTSGGLPLPQASSRPASGVASSDFVREIPRATSTRFSLPRVQSAGQPARRVVVGAAARAASPQAIYGGDEATIDEQVDSYKALVRRFNRKLTEAQVEEIARALLNAAYSQGMDPRFLAAIIAVESDFNIYCLSSSGAMGLGQIMPFNLAEAGMANKADAWNPTKNIHGTARLLRRHLNIYKGRKDGTLLAVAAYNAGDGAVRRAGYKVPGGNSPKARQVQRYVWKVYYRYKEFAPELFR